MFCGVTNVLKDIPSSAKAQFPATSINTVIKKVFIVLSMIHLHSHQLQVELITVDLAPLLLLPAL